MAATLSLEPLVRALTLHADTANTTGISDNGDGAVKTDGSSQNQEAQGSFEQQQKSLAARLQRLWQERGDFSKLSIEKLQAEEDKSSLSSESSKDAGGKAEVKEVEVEGEEGQTAKDGDVASEEAEQTMSQEKLWELKLGILQGLDLARSDITSALDLLQLLLNPLHALVPPVPEEALALPSGSMSSSSLHTPLPAIAQGLHTRNTALALATKTNAIDNAGNLLRRASKRLDKTTIVSQTEWTDLLRLKRSGQWKIEAPAAHVPPMTGPSSIPYAPNIPLEKMAKDLCIFCGIEEASYHWRVAGLVRLGGASAHMSGNSNDKGKGREQKLVIPERLEGRRRMSIKLKLNALGDRELQYMPTYVAPSEDDTHDVLLAVQQELFEEEIFAELIREARDQPFGVTATRNSLAIQYPGTFSLSIEMVSLDDLQDEHPENSHSPEQSLPHLLLLFAKLKMLEIYKRRRRSQSQSTKTKLSTSPTITEVLRNFILYYQLTYKLKQILGCATQAIRSCGIFDPEAVRFDFTGLFASPGRLTSSAILDEMTLGGTACLIMGSQRLNITFSGPSSIVLHLPSRDVSLSSVNDFITLLKRILQSAVLKQLEQSLEMRFKNADDSSAWQILPIPKLVQKGSSALAQKLIPASVNKEATSSSSVEAFISATPKVQMTLSEECQCEIIVEAIAISRKSDREMRETFTSQGSRRNFSEWIQEIERNM